MTNVLEVNNVSKKIGNFSLENISFTLERGQIIGIIGKNGLEDSVIDSARAAITARELIKVKLHNNSPEDKTIFQDLADMLGAELVQVIGFNGVLYKAKKEPKIILPK